MCGRFTLTTPNLEELVPEFVAELGAEAARLYRPRWNVAPTNVHPVLKVQDGVTRLVPARFGVEASGGRFVINARSETAAELRLRGPCRRLLRVARRAWRTTATVVP